MIKKYTCYICNKELNYKPVRFVKQEYGAGNYKQYYQVDRFDLCNKCYEKLKNVVEKARKCTK